MKGFQSGFGNEFATEARKGAPRSGGTRRTGNGDLHTRNGAAAPTDAANRSVTRRAFHNADGEMPIVLQQGRQRFVA